MFDDVSEMCLWLFEMFYKVGMCDCVLLCLMYFGLFEMFYKVGMCGCGSDVWVFEMYFGLLEMFYKEGMCDCVLCLMMCLRRVLDCWRCFIK